VGSFADGGGGSSSGTAYLFDLGPLQGPLSYCDPASGNSVSPTGARLSSAAAFGTAAATFDLADVPDQPGLLYGGGSALDLPFGCGRRCVGGSVVRGDVVVPAGNQLGGVPFDMGLPGLTHVQYWYRDPASAAGCGSSFNLSNALRP